LLRCMSPLLALNRRANRADECPLPGHTGKHVLDLSLSGYDSLRTSRAAMRN
jgi:hypothetical protein